MKLLFTFDETGSDLLQELLGFTDADFKMSNLKSDLYNATDTLIELISKNIYETIIGIFENESASVADKELLYRTQLAIALDAYRHFVLDNDIAHTNNGRVARIEADQKQPWEWQINRSNESLERKYYTAVDALLNFLDNNVSGWKATDAYKDTHALFVRTTKDFDTYFNIGRSRLLLIKLTPGLRLAETSEIKPRVGKALFEEMKAKLKSSEAVDADLLEKIKEACVYKALAWGMGRLSAQLFPEGVLQAKVSDRLTINGKGPTLKSEPEAHAQKFESDANKVLQEIETIITSLTQVNVEPPPPIERYFNENDNFIST